MSDKKTKVTELDYLPQTQGSIWTDRLYTEFPNMKGYEVSEEEFEEWKKKEGL